MSWNQLKEIADENRKQAREERSRPPASCPICGSLLEHNAKRGLLGCPLGHYTVRGGVAG